MNETGDHGSFNSWGGDRFWAPPLAEINQRVAAKPGVERWDAIETIVLGGNRWRYGHHHGWDEDLDDGSSHYLIENNLCLNMGITLHAGFHHAVRNNICVRSGLYPHVWSEKSRDVITRNLFVGGYAPIGMPKVWGGLVDQNLLGRATALEEGDFRVAADSPALAIGFVNFPTDTYGVRTPRLKAKGRHALDTPFETRKAAVVAKLVTWQGATLKALPTLAMSWPRVCRKPPGLWSWRFQRTARPLASASPRWT